MPRPRRAPRSGRAGTTCRSPIRKSSRRRDVLARPPAGFRPAPCPGVGIAEEDGHGWTQIENSRAIAGIGYDLYRGRSIHAPARHLGMTVFERLGHAAGGLSNHLAGGGSPSASLLIGRRHPCTQPSLAMSTFRPNRLSRSSMRADWSRRLVIAWRSPRQFQIQRFGQAGGVQDVKTDHIALVVDFLHHRLAGGLPEVAGLPLEQDFQKIALAVIPHCQVRTMATDGLGWTHKESILEAACPRADR